MEDDDPGAGWHRDPDDPFKFRYWNGSEWTARAETHADVNGVLYIAALGHLKRRRVSASRLVRNPITFHVIAWFDCSVPFTKGRLSRFRTPVELRTLDDVRGP